MYITKFKFKENEIYWEAFAAPMEGMNFTIKVQIIPVVIDHLIYNTVIIRDYTTESHLAKKALMTEKMSLNGRRPLSNDLRISAEIVAEDFLDNRKNKFEACLKEELIELLLDATQREYNLIKNYKILLDRINSQGKKNHDGSNDGDKIC